MAAVVIFGTILHPELKAFYGRGYGHMKNTVSALDMVFAVLALIGARIVAAQVSRGLHIRTAIRTRRSLGPLLRWAAPPGIFVFLVITLSTWANYLSYEAYALMGPAELVFVYLFARCLHSEEKRRRLRSDLPMLGATALGTLLLAVASVTNSSSHAGNSLEAQQMLLAVLAALLCRACQALMTVTLRSCCLKLQGTEGPACSVMEITQWKLCVTALLCVPYALLTEGTEPWRVLCSREFWADSTASGLLLGSIAITLAFQASVVGANSGLRSPVVAVMMGTLQPLAGIMLALSLATTPLAAALQLKHFQPSPLSICGASLLMIGLLLHALERLREVRAQNDEQQRQPGAESAISLNRPLAS